MSPQDLPHCLELPALKSRCNVRDRIGGFFMGGALFDRGEHEAQTATNRQSGVEGVWWREIECASSKHPVMLPKQGRG